MFLSRSLRTVFQRPWPPEKVSARSQPALSTKIHEENLVRYSPGGYHPLRIGDLLKDGAYKIINKLSYGQYSTVWLARDTRLVYLHNRYSKRIYNLSLTIGIETTAT